MSSVASHLSESEYLQLTDHTNRLTELADGQIEVLPMPTVEHQRIVLFLVDLLRAFIAPRKLGEALVAPLRVRLAKGRFREPDLVFVLERNAARQGNRYWTGVDLVMEVVSEDEPQRDLVVKRQEYAEAGIAEYWTIDPRSQSIVILRLENKEYVVHSQAAKTGRVESALLPGFVVKVAEVFAAGRRGGQ